MMKLEHEMKEIKEMLTGFNNRGGAAKKGFAQMLQDIDENENSINASPGDDLRDYISREKAELKKLQ